MIKITFEVNEDFVRENGNPENASSKMGGVKPHDILKSLFDVISFGLLGKQLEKGKTEFVVTPNKLDDKSKAIYDRVLGDICILAAFSETDKENKES